MKASELHCSAPQTSLKVVRLAGGEPLLQAHYEKLLERLPRDVVIDIITNLSVDMSTNRIAQILLRDFENVNWYVGLENLGERHSFVRRGSDWVVLQKNLSILNLFERKVFFLSAFHIFSVAGLEELYQYCRRAGIQPLWEAALEPEELSVFSAPEPVRKWARFQLVDAYQRFGDPQLKSFLDALEVPPVKRVSGARILAAVEAFDRVTTRRGKSFAELWPRLHELCLLS